MLLEEKTFPESWLQNVVVFLPKVPTPSLPEHLRTIVLSSCVAKLFTKTLLRRFCVALMLFWSSRLDRPVEDSQIPNGPTAAISHSFISHSLRVGRVCAENDESQCGLSATTELSQFQLQGAACPQQPPLSMTSPSNSVMTPQAIRLRLARRTTWICLFADFSKKSPSRRPWWVHACTLLTPSCQWRFPLGTARPMRLLEGLYLFHLLRQGCTASACSGVADRRSHVASLPSLPA